MTVKFFETLSNNYLELLDDKEDYNTVINVGESQNVKAFQAHSAILKYRSLYFRNELMNIDKDKNNIKAINLKNVTIQQFEIIIKYIYGGVVLLENLEVSFIFDLMFIAYEFLLEELAQYFQTHLIENEAHWLRLHFNNVYQKSFQNNKLQGLQKWCNDIVVKYPNKVFDSEDFIKLQENALVSLISRDDLQMEEVKIWNHVIEWGIAQNPGLPSDPEDWSNENFISLKTTLRNCLPLIRYFQISGNDIVDNVQSYQPILEKNLWKDIMKRIVDPNKPISSIILPPRIILTPILPIREPFSTVINEEHAAEIASWVDKKDDIYSIMDNPYEFKLLLRGTKDGFTKDSFWNLCDQQTHLVVVIKVKGTDEILGGYNPIGWNKQHHGQYKDCNDSFIFSLKNGTVQNSILSRVNHSARAIICYNTHGPLFGSGCDIAMWDNFNQDKKCWLIPSFVYGGKKIRSTDKYEFFKNIHLISYFSAEEYEIFQINKKT